MSGAFQLITSRVLDASVEEVWQAWTDPALIAEWLTYGGTLVKADVRVGGEFHLDMGGCSDANKPHTGRYLALEPPHRLAFTWVSAFTGGESEVEVTLKDVGDAGRPRCEVTLVHSGLPTQAMADDHREGWYDFIRLAGEAVAAARAGR